jgi:hypothetical protein
MPCNAPTDVDDILRRCAPYVGLTLFHSPENCPDLLYCYEQIYEIRIQRGGRQEGYSQFKAVAGQLARFAVAAEVVTAEEFCSPGGLLQLATNSRLIRAFIGYFQKHAQASTVYSKATLLGTLCKMARQHFGKIAATDTPATLRCVDETTNLLGAFRCVEKRQLGEKRPLIVNWIDAIFSFPPTIGTFCKHASRMT